MATRKQHPRIISGRDTVASCTSVLFGLLLALGGFLFAADVTGKWTFTVETGAGTGSAIFELVQKGTVEGNTIEFVVTAGQGELKYSGTIESATQMSGKADYPEIGNTTWKATKDK